MNKITSLIVLITINFMTHAQDEINEFSNVIEVKANEPSLWIKTGSAHTGSHGRPSLFIERGDNEEFKLAYVPNVLARISNTYVGLGSKMAFSTSGEDRLIKGGHGMVGIGTDKLVAKLTVAGDVHSREVKVDVSAGRDFVFDEDYHLPSLGEYMPMCKRINICQKYPHLRRWRKTG